MAELVRARSSVRTAVIWSGLRPALAKLCSGRGDAAVQVLDVGGGTGGFAVPLAAEGHRVTVLDPSPDALAALGRRVAEADVGPLVRAVQGDADAIAGLDGAGDFDLVLCHGVLEHTEDPEATLRSSVNAARPGGLVSLLVGNRNAAVLARAVGGHVGAARHVLADPAGRWGAQDPLPRRYSLDQITALTAAVGARVQTVHGVRVFADLVPAAAIEGDAAAREDLLALESAVAEDPAFIAIAGQLHLIVARS